MDFALAQQRIAARRQAREDETRSRLNARRDESGTGRQITQLPFLLDRLGQTSFTTLDSIRGREGTRPEFRIGQVDAELLDEELLELLKGQVGEGLKYFGSHIQDGWSAEIMLVLRAVLFKLSVWDHDATYGAALQNLKFIDARKRSTILASPSKWQKALYGIFTVGGQYIWRRWEDWLVGYDNDYDQPNPIVWRLSNITLIFSNIYSTAAVVSFLIFLVNGRYRTLLDRILRLRLAPPTGQVSREVSFVYLNRQLVWHAFTEFLLFVLPLVGISRWRRWLSRAWRKTRSMIPSEGAGEDGDRKGELSFLPERTCGICYQDQTLTSMSEAEILAASSGGGASGGVIGSAQTDITNPYETIPCGCIYCFVCLASRLEAEEGSGWVCLRCGKFVKECQAWNGDVIEEATETISHSKSVGFLNSQGDESNTGDGSGNDKDDDAAFQTADELQSSEERASISSD